MFNECSPGVQSEPYCEIQSKEMWKQCKWDGKDYLMKHTVHDAVHKLYVTDTVYIWYEEIGEDNLLQRCKELNKFLEANDRELLNLLWSLVEGGGNEVISSFSDNTSGKILSLQSNVDDLLKFRIKFILNLADPRKFFEEFSCPLLITITELEKRQRLLLEIIKKKDIEIAEYKLEGAKISRGSVETPEFDVESFSRRCAEGLGTTKGLVQARPFHTFTPLIQELLENTERAIAVAPRESGDECQVKEMNVNCKKTKPIKLKSPVKTKKTKIYEDEISDEEDNKEDCDNSSIRNLEHKKDYKSKATRANKKADVKKVLSNL